MLKRALKPITIFAYALALASKGNPVRATITVMLYWGMFIFVEVGIERLIWGERFEHWLDPMFSVCFIAFAAHAVWQCAIVQTIRKEEARNEP